MQTRGIPNPNPQRTHHERYLKGGMPILRASCTPEESRHSHRGVFFDVRSAGPPVRITALAGGGAWGADRRVTVYAREGGAGAGRETERGGWREVGAGVWKKKQSTRLALASPVGVRAGATVGMYVHTTDGADGVYYAEPGERGAVDASDGAIALLCGRATSSREHFGEPQANAFFVPAGSVEYELAIPEADPPAPAPAKSPRDLVCEMGFAPSEATVALQASGGDVARAIERLLRSRAEAEQATALAKAEAAKAKAVAEAVAEAVALEQMKAAATQAQAEAKLMLAQAEAAGAKAWAEEAAAKVASPGPKSGPTIDEWLDELDLGGYAAAVKEEGYTTLRFLKDAEEQDLDEMAQGIGMKRPHVRTLKRAWKQLVAEVDSGGAAASTASEPEPEPASEPGESHGARIEPQAVAHEFDLVFSNKTAFDPLCLQVRAQLVPDGVRVWQQRTNIPKDSDNCAPPHTSPRVLRCGVLAIS